MPPCPREDRGATMVEFAFVLPVLALLFAALTDLGFMVLGNSVASNAAREGARVGIIHFRDADDSSSASFDAISDAVTSKLSGWVKPGVGDFIEVRCLDGDDLDVVKPCDENIDIDHDLIEVTVSWEGVAGTGLIPVDRTQTDVARMVISGGADGGAGGPVVPGGSVAGFDPVAYGVTETDSPTGSSVTLTITRTNANGVASVNVATMPGTAVDGADFTPLLTTVNFPDGQPSTTVDVEIVGDDASESQESFTVVLTDPVGVTLGPSTTATVTIDDDDGAPPPACTGIALVGATISVDLKANGQVEDAVSFTVNLNPSAALCTAPRTAQVIGGSAGTWASPQTPAACGATSCTWTIPKNSSPWDVGTKDLQVTVGGQTFVFDDVVVAT